MKNKRFIFLIFTFLLSFNVFATWNYFDTDAGGIGIYQNMATGKDTSQISIYQENGGYSFVFLTDENVSTYEFFQYKADFTITNDKKEPYSFSAKQIAGNAFKISNIDGFLKYMKKSKWIKIEFFINNSFETKVLKFNTDGLEKVLVKVKE